MADITDLSFEVVLFGLFNCTSQSQKAMAWKTMNCVKTALWKARNVLLFKKDVLPTADVLRLGFSEMYLYYLLDKKRNCPLIKKCIYRLRPVNMASLHDGEPTTPLLMENVDEEKQIGTHSHEMDEEKGYCSEPQDTHALTGVSYMRSVITVVIMSFVSLIHYIERFSASGVLPDLQKAFNMSDSVSGLLHTVFIASYMLFGPVFGYMGDRWNRKYIMCAGTLFWSIMTLSISFVPNQYFLLLLAMRALVGVGEASFSTVAPSVIADLFVADQRSRMFSIFYLTIPVGCGLGYIIGSKVVSAAGGDWHWAFRVTPGLGVIAVLLLLIFVKEPPRGAADGKNKNKSVSSNNWISDVKKLFKNRSFLFSTLGCATVAFVAGAIGLWAPSFLTRARSLLLEKEPCQTGTCTYNDSLIFGVLTVISGILGVLAGVEISKKYRKTNPRADPLVCACGLLCSAPFLFLALVLADISLVATYVFIFIGETFLTFNWALVAEILLSVVPPTRRATAGAVQVTVAHLLGDVGSPYLIGFISDLIHGAAAETTLSRYRSLKYALLTCAFMEAIGGAFFLVNAHFIERDRKEAETESEVTNVKSSIFVISAEQSVSCKICMAHFCYE
ncbi:protein spinster homolog 1-like [Leptodactylus fuscus]|uniref:protein spinster homolog 1-like n=1 Tax=Leptodactylus fuscus TaxID=238119 RepID=UPI003F4EBF0A